MKILAIDTTHSLCSAAFFDGRKIVSEIVEEKEHGQAERLIPMIQEVLEKATACFQDIEAVAVTTGPGSFTGVRVGLAAADGIALAADLPMIGVSLLDVLAWKAYKQNPTLEKICLVLETKRDDFYVQMFDKGHPLTPASVLSAQKTAEIKDCLFAGNAVERLIEEVGDVPKLDVSMPTAGEIAQYASEKTPRKEYPEPLYLREAEVTLCRK